MTGTAAQQTQASKAKTFPRSQLKALASTHDTSRGEFVYQALLDAIRHGRLRQGDRVREDEISESLNVSRTPVREALHRMQLRSLLIARSYAARLTSGRTRSASVPPEFIRTRA